MTDHDTAARQDVDHDEKHERLLRPAAAGGVTTAANEQAGRGEPGERTTRLPNRSQWTEGEHAAEADDRRRVCPTCRGTGRVFTVNDVLREMLAFLPVEDPRAMDAFVADFYARLLELDEKKLAGDRLATLFPKDLVAGAYGDQGSEGFLQRDKLLGELVHGLRDYDPDRWEVQPALQAAYDARLRKAGESHTGWVRPDGQVRPASRREYEQVGDLLHTMLRAKLGGQWRAEYSTALGLAYEYMMIEMLHAQQHAVAAAPRLARRERP
jgi:hypothetical protein